MPSASASTLTTNDLKTLATAEAAAYSIDSETFLKVIECESHWNPTAVSKTGDYGLVQIHLKAHPDISLREANDPFFALDWAAKEWSLGHARAWTCYRLLK